MRKVRVLSTIGGTAALGALFLSAAWGAPRAASRPPEAAPVAAAAGLTPFDSCTALRAWYVAQGLREVGPYGWGNGQIYNETGDLAMERGPGAAPYAASGSTGSSTDGPQAAVGSSATGTNTQEKGVDEPDIAKTDGTLLARVVGGRLLLSDVSGSRPRRLASYRLPPTMFGAELLLVGDRLVVTSQDGYSPGPPIFDRESFPAPYPPLASAGVRVLVLDVSDPARPSEVSDQVFTGSSISVRQYGSTVRVVTSTAAPNLHFVYPGTRGASVRQALAHNRQVVRRSTLDDWLPTVRDSDPSGAPGVATQRLVGCSKVLHPLHQAGSGTVTVVGFDVSTPGERSAVAITAGGDTVYSSTDQLYVATTRAPIGILRPLSAGTSARGSAPSTQIHAFGLTGTGARYLASGSVPGTLRDRWSMDAYDGHLRLALQTGSGMATEDGASRAGANAVVVLTRDGNQLVATGRLSGLGRGEEIKSVRWFDDLAVVVTFRQLDPLHTVDLSDPERPRLLGQLKIPGFSGYLHPIGNDLLLGIGTDADDAGRVKGALMSVFDLSDRAHPAQVGRHVFGPYSYLSAPDDPRSFTWLPNAGAGWTQLSSWAVNGMHSTRLVRIAVASDGRMSVRSVDLPRAAVGQPTRVLPLPDGRVVVVSGRVVRTMQG